MKIKFLNLYLAGVIGIMSCHITPSKTQKGMSNNLREYKSGLKPTDFKKEIDGKATALYELKNRQGMVALITNYGGRLVSLYVPNKFGKLTDVVAGFENLDGYIKSTEPYFGATIGRYGNRIAKGQFILGGKTYDLYINNGLNTLHGGKKGYQDVVWDAEKINKQKLELRYLSKDMEEGFPGNLVIKVTYFLKDDNSLQISYEASTDQTTVINLTNHAFFNLNGEGKGSILSHQVQIKADDYLPVDNGLIPLGREEMVRGTPFDFRRAATIGSRINDNNDQLKNGNGYDHNFVLNKHAMRTPVARVQGDKSGIVMEVFTDQPGLQFYSGNFMQGKNIMKGGKKDEFRTAFAMETQHFPDSPNQHSFPSTTLRPGQIYRSKSGYRFYYLH